MDKQNQVNAQSLIQRTHQQSSQTASSQSVNPLNDKELSPSLTQGIDGWIYLSEVIEQRSHLLLPLVGYGLLLFALFDYVPIVISPQFTDPTWELKTIGDLVEHVAVPLIGLLFVFYRDQGYIFRMERNFLGFLSWVCLLVGILYLLMLPLGIADTWRLYYANKVQVTARTSQQSQQLQQAKGLLQQAKTDEQIKQVVTSLTPRVRSEDIKNPQEFREQFLAKISEGEQKIKVQADNAWTDQSQTLLKNSIKWNLGALVSGTLFILIWHLTDWARSREY